MKKVITENTPKTEALISDVPDTQPIFAVKGGEIKGMFINEHHNGGWILRFSNGAGSSGHYRSRLDCLRAAENQGYEIVTE